MEPSLRFAIIGCGKIAPRHAAETVKYGQLVAVCDTVKEKADELAASYRAKPYYTIDDLFKNETPDIVAVCTPNGLHAEHTVKALHAGANVLCEKPLSTSSADALAMMEAARSVGKKLFVVKSTRYNPALVALKKAIQDDQLGDIYSFQLNCFWNRPAAYYANSWKGDKTLDGGTLYTQFSHYIDALLWLLGDMKIVTGISKNFAHQGIIDFEDSGVASVEMKNGTIGGINWSVNTFQKNMEVSLSLIAEKGSIRIGGEYMNTITYQLADGFELSNPDDGKANDYGFYKGSMSNHDKIYENLVKALYDNTHPFANAADGLKTVETIERIYNSVSLR
ncbi:MAG: Gfo/Idh/MocA family oxidoreductase [Chitinophagaceae bacterium]|nr:Gfo/Idh/MocA family oxidoreductase [Chitinophagaceae bacterium]